MFNAVHRPDAIVQRDGQPACFHHPSALMTMNIVKVVTIVVMGKSARPERPLDSHLVNALYATYDAK